MCEIKGMLARIPNYESFLKLKNYFVKINNLPLLPNPLSCLFTAGFKGMEGRIIKRENKRGTKENLIIGYISKQRGCCQFLRIF